MPIVNGIFIPERTFQAAKAGQSSTSSLATGKSSQLERKEQQNVNLEERINTLISRGTQVEGDKVIQDLRNKQAANQQLIEGQLTAQEREERGLAPRTTAQSVRDLGFTPGEELVQKETSQLLQGGVGVSKQATITPGGGVTEQDSEFFVTQTDPTTGQAVTKKVGLQEALAQATLFSAPLRNKFAPGDAGSSQFAQAEAIFNENQQLSQVAESALKSTAGLEANLGTQLESIRAESTRFKTLLNSQLEFNGIDERIQEIENRYGVLVDREDEEVVKRLQETVDARKTGILQEEEFGGILDNVILKNAKSVADVSAELNVPLPGEVIPEAGAEAEVEVDAEVPVPPKVILPEGVSEDPETGIRNYTDSKTGITYETNPGTGTIDINKLNPSDLDRLDGPSLLVAEAKLNINQAVEFDKQNQAFLDSLAGKILESQEIATEAHKITFDEVTEDARLSQQKSLDMAELGRQELALQQAESFEDIAEAQGKMEGYLKGKLSAYGAGESSAAIAIMSSNTMKYAKLKNKTSAKFALAYKDIAIQEQYTQLAFTNTVINAQKKFSNNASQLANSTQQSLLQISGQKLKSNQQKDAEIRGANIKMLTDLRQNRAALAKAEADAKKDSLDFMKKQIDMERTRSLITGSVWEWSDDGQLYDTGNPTIATQLALMKTKSGKGAGSGVKHTKNEIQEWVDIARQHLPDDEINLEIERRWKGTSKDDDINRQGARDYLNDTTQASSGILSSSILGTVADAFDVDLPEAPKEFFTTPEKKDTPLVNISSDFLKSALPELKL